MNEQERGTVVKDTEDFRIVELEVLIKYWAEARLTDSYAMWASGVYSEDRWERQSDAGQRIAGLALYLGHDRAEALVRQVERKFSQSLDPEHWKRFSGLIYADHYEERYPEANNPRDLVPDSDERATMGWDSQEEGL